MSGWGFCPGGFYPEGLLSAYPDGHPGPTYESTFCEEEIKHGNFDSSSICYSTNRALVRESIFTRKNVGPVFKWINVGEIVISNFAM